MDAAAAKPDFQSPGPEYGSSSTGAEVITACGASLFYGYSRIYPKRGLDGLKPLRALYFPGLRKGLTFQWIAQLSGLLSEFVCYAAGHQAIRQCVVAGG